MRSRDVSRLRAVIGPREAINIRGANQEVQSRLVWLRNNNLTVVDGAPSGVQCLRRKDLNDTWICAWLNSVKRNLTRLHNIDCNSQTAAPDR